MFCIGHQVGEHQLLCIGLVAIKFIALIGIGDRSAVCRRDVLINVNADQGDLIDAFQGVGFEHCGASTQCPAREN